MAVAQLIDISNYDSMLVESSQGRAGSPDGNIYFDTANDRIEIITREENSQVDLGSGLEDNPLTNADGITLQALYAFEVLRRRVNTSLRSFKPGSVGQFKFSGAFAFVNGIKLADDGDSSTGDDRRKIRASGFVEFAVSGDGKTNIDRIYFGARSLNDIDAASQPYGLLAASTSESDRQAATPFDFYRTGPIDEVVQVFGTTAHGDAGAGNFDSTDSVLILGVRPFGRTFGETNSTLAGVSELNGFSTGFGIGDSPNDDNNFTLADVFGGAQVSPWTGMSYETFGSAQTRSGFTTADGSYDTIISNDNGGSLLQVIAFLDALMLQDTDQDDGAGTYLPKRGAPLYTKDSQGRFVTKQGVHIDNIPASDQQSIVQTDNAGEGKVYPFSLSVRVSVSDAWANDANGWYRAMFTNGTGTQDFDNANAIVVDDAQGADVEGTSADVLGSAGSYYIEFSFDYDGNAQAGLAAGTDKNITFLAEGDGGATAAIAQFDITRTSIVAASALSSAETNL